MTAGKWFMCNDPQTENKSIFSSNSVFLVANHGSNTKVHTKLRIMCAVTALVRNTGWLNFAVNQF